MDNTLLERLDAGGSEEREAARRIRELEERVTNWRDAHERAAVIAAEAANKQKAELEARLAEANARVNQW